ncbi:MAG: AAA family ATPase [Pseudomonadota bacterium]
MKRVMIIGQPGSGKSTLARAIAVRTGLPVVHMDQIQWRPGWVETDREERRRLTLAAHARDTWVFEGGFSATWADRIQRADTLIWLDVPVATRLWRVSWRTIRYFGQSRPDLPDGCPERFSWEFFRYIWNTRKTSRSKMQNLFDNAPPEKSKHRLSTRGEVSTYLTSLR